MRDTLDTTRRDSILQAAVADKVFLAADDGPVGGSRFRIFGSMASRYAILMRVQPTLCAVVTSIFS